MKPYMMIILFVFCVCSMVIAIYQFTDNRAGDGSLSLLYSLVFLAGAFYKRLQLKKTGRKKTNP